MKEYSILLFALIAAVGNALFAAGQKKTSGIDNPLIIVGMSALICVALTFAVIFLLNKNSGMVQIFKSNWIWILMSGFGLFLTYIGFNLLYSRFGTSGYIYYAVLSIITTSLIVGVIIFKEHLNIYHIISVGLAVAAIVLFTIGNNTAG